MTSPEAVLMTEQAAWTGRKYQVVVNGQRIAVVERAGSEPALVLVHGFTDTSRSHSLLAPHLAGRRLLIPDLRGHGGSEGCNERVPLADYAADIIGLVEALEVKRPVLAGHSLGSMVAIEACARRPDLFGGLVLIAGTLRPEIGADHPVVAGVATLQDPILPSDPFFAYWHDCRPHVPRCFLAKAAQEASAMPARRWRSILSEIRSIDLRPAARTLVPQILIIAGTEDPLFGLSHQWQMLTTLPRASAFCLAGCGHNPHWEEPALVASAITAMFPAG